MGKEEVGGSVSMYVFLRRSSTPWAFGDPAPAKIKGPAPASCKILDSKHLVFLYCLFSVRLVFIQCLLVFFSVCLVFLVFFSVCSVF